MKGIRYHLFLLKLRVKHCVDGAYDYSGTDRWHLLDFGMMERSVLVAFGFGWHHRSDILVSRWL